MFFFASRGESAIATDLGSAFLVSYGCSSSSSWKGFYCYDYNYCSNTLPYSCYSSAYQVTGWIISCANMGMLVLGVLYTWIGSWCCSCCCHELEDNNPTSADVQTVRYVTTSNNPYGTRNVNTVVVPQTYTLFVHHGGPFPTKMVVVASSLREMEMFVSQNLGLSVPFRMAVFDDLAKQYVMVSTMELIPTQATIQLIFQWVPSKKIKSIWWGIVTFAVC